MTTPIQDIIIKLHSMDKERFIEWLSLNMTVLTKKERNMIVKSHDDGFYQAVNPAIEFIDGEDYYDKKYLM